MKCSWLEMQLLETKTISDCVEFHKFSSHDLGEWCLLTFMCPYSHIHFCNISTEARTCLRNESSTDENLITVSTKVIYFLESCKRHLEPKHLETLFG